MAELEIHYPDGLVGFRPLTQDKVIILGTDPRCDVSLVGPGFLRKHCSVRWVRDAYRLEAAPGAKNLRVRGVVIKRARLRPDEEFWVGEYRLYVRGSEGEILEDSMALDVDVELLEDVLPVEPVEAQGGEAAYYTPMWKSPLFVGIAGGLAVLCLVGLILWLVVRQTSAGKQYDAALADLNDGKFAQSIQRFDAFLKDFPSGQLSAQARVWRGIARVRQFTDTAAPSWSNALEAAGELVAEAEDLHFFKERSADVTDLILRTAEGLALHARNSVDPGGISNALEALALAEKAFGRGAVPAEKQDHIRGLIEQARAAIEQESVRKAALARMDAALAAQRPMDVYREHRQLYVRYPGLQRDADCLARRAKARALEQAAIAWSPAPAPSAPSPAASPTPAWTLARRKAEAALEKGTGVLAVLVADTLYALNAGTGQVRWRFPIGHQPAFPPLVVPADPTRLLAHATRDNSLVLFETETGKVLWRRPLAGVELVWGSRPLVHRGNVYAVGQPTDEAPGRLMVFRLADGRLSGWYSFPQPLAASPALDPGRDAVLVVGEQASLYTLLPAEQRCTSVLALDHETESVRAAPVVAGRFLFLAQNLAPGKAQVRCFVFAPDGTAPERPAADVNGWVWHAPVIRGGRLFVTSDLDHFAVYDLGGEEDPKPMTLAARSLASLEAPVEQPYPLPVTEREFWTVGAEVRYYPVRLSEGRTRPELTVDLPGTLVQSPETFGGSVLAACRDAKSGLVSVLAIDTKSRAERWRTELGRMPEALRADPSQTGGVLVTLGGATRKLSADDLAADRVVEEPPPTAGTAATPAFNFHVVWSWKEGVLQWAGVGRDRLMYYPPGGAARELRLPSAAGGLPAVFGRGVLVPAADGLVYWIDPRTGTELAEPFVGPYVNERPVPITAVTGIDDKTALAVVGRAVVKLGLVREPFPHFTEIARFELRQGEASNLVAFAGKVLMTHADQLVSLRPEDFEVQDRQALGAPVTLPPAPAGDVMVFLTERNELVAAGNAPGAVDVRWRTKLPTRPVAPPVPLGDSLWVALADGTLLRIEHRDGSVAQQLSVGRALVDGPWVLADRLVVLAADGSLTSLRVAEKKP